MAKKTKQLKIKNLAVWVILAALVIFLALAALVFGIYRSDGKNRFVETIEKAAPFPAVYVKGAGFINISEIKEVKDFTHEQIHKIFMLSTKKFMSGEICTEQLSDIANYLYNSLLASNKAEGKLYEALQAASELTFYIRTAEKTHTLEKFRDRIVSYYKSFSGEPPAQS